VKNTQKLNRNVQETAEAATWMRTVPAEKTISMTYRVQVKLQGVDYG
jgi:hypothetical protein